ANTQPDNLVNFSSREMQEFHSQMDLFKSEITSWRKSGFSVIILAPNKQRAKRIQSILEDYEIYAAVNEEFQLLVEKPIITIGNIQTGIELPLYKLALITENELFKKRTTRTRRRKISNAERIKSYQELKIGDYVVHASHGVGKYLGIET